ncbi:hypothetical protein MICRO8M_90056 [Microbacterium sp. 8M]|nr:hypothetical protein MICRO8M_90056 [Microbacterium sp. 8M]
MGRHRLHEGTHHAVRARRVRRSPQAHVVGLPAAHHHTASHRDLLSRIGEGRPNLYDPRPPAISPAVISLPPR